MSETKEQFNEKVLEAVELEKRKKEVAAKKFVLEERKVNTDLETLQTNDLDIEIAQKTNFGTMTEEQIARVRQENKDYMEGAKKKLDFINEEFAGVIPFFRKNLILIGGQTGQGKSTTVANIVSSVLKQTNLSTGERCRVLVITNEEKAEDVYNRITCLSKGWPYQDHDKFSDEQIATFDQYIPILAKNGWLTVVDDSFGSTKDVKISGVTTSLEGIATIFDNLIRDKCYYDVVLIDYYQNIKDCKNNPKMDEWKVQAKLTAMLDQYKNEYPAPIVLLAQVRPPDAEDSKPFLDRIEGRKVILNACTVAMEMVRDTENLRTLWRIHKSRFGSTIGKKVMTGFENGRFVPYTAEFMAKVNEMKERKAALEHDKAAALHTNEEKEDG